MYMILYIFIVSIKESYFITHGGARFICDDGHSWVVRFF